MICYVSTVSDVNSSMILYYIFFFFSSRRRHTRYWRDWSSDVCSSDLLLVTAAGVPRRIGYDRDGRGFMLTDRLLPMRRKRSEERRVGKECRSRWSPYH